MLHCTILDVDRHSAKRILKRWSKLQQTLDAWLHHYNRERTHWEYRNREKRLIGTINEYLTIVRKDD